MSMTARRITNPAGARTQKRGHGEGGLVKKPGSRFYSVIYRIGRKQFCKTTGETNIVAAREAAHKIIEREKGGQQIEADPTKLTYELLRQTYIDYLQTKGKKSLMVRKQDGLKTGEEGDLTVNGMNHLDAEFNGWKALQITNSAVTRLVKKMQHAGLSNATVNGALATLRRMFNLAKDKKLLRVIDGPNIKVEMMKKPEPRKGFIRHAEFLRLKTALPEHIRNVSVVAYNTGARKGELLNLRWRNVDLKDGFIRLRPEETKSGEGRLIPLDNETVKLLTKLDRFKRIDDYVFQGRMKGPNGKGWIRSGKKIADANINKVWNTTCVREKIIRSTPDGDVVSHREADGSYVGLIPHDLRRSYVRSIDNSGVSASLGAKITGHLDATVYEAYNQKHQDDLRNAAKQRREWIERAG